MQVGPLLGNAGLQLGVVRVMTGLEDLGVVDIRPAPGWLRRMWIGSVEAMTLGSRIYVEPALLASGGERLGTLLVHELVHVRQWRQTGPLRFLFRYTSDYLRGRFAGRSHADAYRNIRAEVEARTIAGR